MNCRQTRKQLAASLTPDAAMRHIETCEPCARFAARLERARQMFREHHTEFAPDAGFASRVVRQLQVDPPVSLSWAAARVLPVTLALLAVLAWFSWATPESSHELTSPTDDLLGWVIDGDGVDR